MNPVKQALFAFKQNWKESLYLGVAATIFTFFAQVVPFIGAFLISLGLLIFQELANLRLSSEVWKKDLSHLQNDWISFIITAVILMPTGILLGSAFGVVESPQSRFESWPMALGLFILGVYFFLILSHGLILQQERHQGIARTLDVAALASIKNFKTYLAASFYIGIALVIGSLLKGVGFVIALPFLFYCDYFVFKVMKDKNAFDKKKE